MTKKAKYTATALLVAATVALAAFSLVSAAADRTDTPGGKETVMAAATAPPPGITRADLQRHDLSVGGREVIQARVELAPGVSSVRHWHPGEEIVYVLEGALVYEVEGKAPVTLKAGDVLFIPARTIHAARNDGSVPGAELATYVVEKGKPLFVPVK